MNYRTHREPASGHIGEGRRRATGGAPFLERLILVAEAVTILAVLAGGLAWLLR